MNETEAPLTLARCDLTTLDTLSCEQFVSWLLGKEAAAPAAPAGLDWALAHCDDGVTWGRFDAATGAWRLGSEAAPDLSPPIRAEALQELRLFGERSEVLIWRSDSHLRGRVLAETDPVADRSDEDDPLRPSDDSRVLRGAYVVAPCDHGFTQVGDGAGAEQLLPLAAVNEQIRDARIRLDVRHYYEIDAATGAVRIAATRLVRLTVGGSHGG